MLAWRVFAKLLQNSFGAGVAQLVERDLAKVEVAGSSPVARSMQFSSIHWPDPCLHPIENRRIVARGAGCSTGETERLQRLREPRKRLQCEDEIS
jgi:hypothetical protein